MCKNNHLVKLECVYCKRVFTQELIFSSIEEIVQCPYRDCKKKSKVSIGDVNAVQEVYRGTNNQNATKTRSS
jgi:hypothetical protein